MFLGEKYRKYMKVIPWELHHRVMVVDLDKKGLKKDYKKGTDHKRKDLEVE